MARTGLRAAWDISSSMALTTGRGWQYTDGDVTGQSTHQFVVDSDAYQPIILKGLEGGQ